MCGMWANSKSQGSIFLNFQLLINLGHPNLLIPRVYNISLENYCFALIRNSTSLTCLYTVFLAITRWLWNCGIHLLQRILHKVGTSQQHSDFA